MVRSFDEACREAKIEAHGMFVGAFKAINYCVQNQYIGTGSRRTADGPEHCIFKFTKEPHAPFFSSLVAALGFFHDTDVDSDEEMETLRQIVLEQMAGTEFAPDRPSTGRLRHILRRVEYLDCSCAPIPPADPRASSCSSRSLK